MCHKTLFFFSFCSPSLKNVKNILAGRLYKNRSQADSSLLTPVLKGIINGFAFYAMYVLCAWCMIFQFFTISMSYFKIRDNSADVLGWTGMFPPEKKFSALSGIFIKCQ